MIGQKVICDKGIFEVGLNSCETGLESAPNPRQNLGWRLRVLVLDVTGFWF